MCIELGELLWKKGLKEDETFLTLARFLEKIHLIKIKDHYEFSER